MDKYENLVVVGEGSYGIVMKCRHRETGQVVAIKKFFETEEDAQIRKLAYREIRMLKKLRHENLVNMIEVFRSRRRFYLVFEYMDHTVLDELEQMGGRGLGWEVSKRYIFQILRGLNFCHINHIMHRDVKPENILISVNGVIKLCDFGFARLVVAPNESCTDYVATRWYRAPELLVGDSRYGRPVDVWAVGCLFAEMMTGDPLFPGDSDVDQLHRITKVLGKLCCKHQTMINSGSVDRILRRVSVDEMAMKAHCKPYALRAIFPSWNPAAVDFLSQCLRMDPEYRPRCSALLQHPLFTQDGFAERFLNELQRYVAMEEAANPLSTRRAETRTINVLSSESSMPPPLTRVTRSSTGRWKMTLLKHARSTIDEATTTSEPPNGEKEEVRRLGKPAMAQQTIKSRELCYFGPVSVIPNTTYIRRLEQKGLLMSDSKLGSSLPVLAPKDFSLSKTNYKRKRVDLPSVDR